MKHAPLAALLATAALAAPAAAHATTYKLDKINITGSHTLPTASLMAVVKEKPGTTVSTDDIIADQTAISDALQKANVVGAIATQLLGPKPNGHYEVIFAITDKGAQAPTVTKVAPKLDAQIIDGNTSVTTETLVAATGLKPGDDMDDAKVSAAEQAIAASYKAAKVPMSINIQGETKMLAGGKVDLLWHVKESKPTAAKKKRSSEDEGGLKVDQ